MKLIAFAASSSSKSINKILATYVAGLVDGAEVEILDLRDYELPLFSIDREEELGQPVIAKKFLEKIASADRLIISFAEHNGNYSAAYKNLFDWCTRIDAKVYQDKPTLLLATSPGGRGAASVLGIAENALPRFGCEIRASLSVPSFNENFDTDQMRISDPQIQIQLEAAVNLLVA
jgi:chromate reductase, NAD(P)H dehydrogenase (quinone)